MNNKVKAKLRLKFADIIKKRRCHGNFWDSARVQSHHRTP